MNKKKKEIITLLILLIFAIVIGYAISSTNFIKLKGSRSAAASNFDIQYKKSVAVTYDKSTTESITVTGAYTDKDNATMTVTGLKKVNDYASATFTVENVSDDLAASITASITSNVKDKDHYKVEVTVNKGNNVAANGGTCTVTAKVTLIKAFNDSEEEVVQNKFSIKITGTAVE